MRGLMALTKGGYRPITLRSMDRKHALKPNITIREDWGVMLMGELWRATPCFRWSSQPRCRELGWRRMREHGVSFLVNALGVESSDSWRLGTSWMSGVCMSLEPSLLGVSFARTGSARILRFPFVEKAICLDCVAAYDIDYLWRVLTFWVLKK